MSKIYYIIGKSASGKDSILRRLVEDPSLSLREIIQYTTRPIRSGETEGVGYHFVSEDTVQRFLAEGKIIEMRTYDTVYGPWRYFMADDGEIKVDRETKLDDEKKTDGETKADGEIKTNGETAADGDYIAVGTVESYRKVSAYYGNENVIPIYIFVEDGVRLLRAVNREQESTAPKYAELCRRFLADEKDFDKAHLQEAGLMNPDGSVRNQFDNNDFEDCLANIKAFIQNQTKSKQ